MQTIKYSAPIASFANDGETPVYRHANHLAELVKTSPRRRTVNTFQKLLFSTFDQHYLKPALGSRVRAEDGTFGEYKFKTYGDVEKIVHNLASGIEKLELAPKISEYEDLSLSFLGVYSKNREEYLMIDMVSAMYGHTIVPIYDTLGPDAVQFVFEQTNLTTLFCSNEYLPALLTSAKNDKLGKVKNIVVWDTVHNDSVFEFENAGINLIEFASVCDKGAGSRAILPDVSPDDVMVFSYTSGTTSTPKAAMLTHRNFIAALAGVEAGSDDTVKFTSDDVHLSYLPLAHIYDRLACSYMLAVGGSIGFYSGDITKIKEDIQALKPTFFASVPRLYNKIYDGIVDGMNKQKGIKKMLVDWAVSSKLANLKHSKFTSRVFDALVFNKIRNAFGGNLRFMTTAAAPIAGNRLSLLKISMSCPIAEVYGQTESCGASFMTHTLDAKTGHVGGISPAAEFKLVDIPEMNYTSKDVDENGILRPRGEICLRGPMIFRGYYKDPEKTAEAIDSDGWLHTGDVGVVDLTGRLTIIDRKKNIFKLSQGEYVAVEKVETVLLRSKLIEEIIVHGDSLESYVVAVVVPNKNITSDPADILKEIKTLGKAEGLKGFEVPQKIHVSDKTFGDLGLLTATMKVKRIEAKTYFKSTFDTLYA
jgi:long-chain acyl-CoA synthetase